MADSSDVDDALMAKLQGDATLAALCQTGAFVFWEQAKAGSTKFVVVSLVDEQDVPMFSGTAHEDAVYLVKFVALSTAGADVKAAAARIQALLHGGTLTIPGYGFQVLRRTSRVRTTEVDDADSSIRWFHRGGRYQLRAAPIGT